MITVENYIIQLTFRRTREFVNLQPTRGMMASPKKLEITLLKSMCARQPKCRIAETKSIDSDTTDCHRPQAFSRGHTKAIATTQTVIWFPFFNKTTHFCLLSVLSSLPHSFRTMELYPASDSRPILISPDSCILERLLHCCSSPYY